MVIIKVILLKRRKSDHAHEKGNDAEIDYAAMAGRECTRLLLWGRTADLAIAEYMPWEAIVTRRLLRKLPLVGG